TSRCDTALGDTWRVHRCAALPPAGDGPHAALAAPSRQCWTDRGGARKRGGPAAAPQRHGAPGGSRRRGTGRALPGVVAHLSPAESKLVHPPADPAPQSHHFSRPLLITTSHDHFS